MAPTAPDSPLPGATPGRPSGSRRGSDDPLFASGRGLLRNPWFWTFIIGCVTVTLIRPLTRHEPEPPPVIGQLPAFSLTDQGGNAYGSDELAGHVYITSFFFTSCTTICPRIMGGMRRLQDRFDQHKLDVRLISITVDPENDTPERLREKASEYGVDAKRWRLLTGDESALKHVIVEGFKTYMGKRAQDADGIFDIGHGARLVLVDAEGGVRGHYGTDEEGLDEVFWRARHVLSAMH